MHKLDVHLPSVCHSWCELKSVMMGGMMNITH